MFTEGKLKLVRANPDVKPHVGNLCTNVVHPLFLWTQQHIEGNVLQELVEYRGTKVIFPVVTTDKDIEKYDMYLEDGKVIGIVTQPTQEELDYINKRKPYFTHVLVNYDKFSTRHIKGIIEGWLKDGDELEVEVEFVPEEKKMKLVVGDNQCFIFNQKPKYTKEKFQEIGLLNANLQKQLTETQFQNVEIQKMLCSMNSYFKGNAGYGEVGKFYKWLRVFSSDSNRETEFVEVDESEYNEMARRFTYNQVVDAYANHRMPFID